MSLRDRLRQERDDAIESGWVRAEQALIEFLIVEAKLPELGKCVSRDCTTANGGHAFLIDHPEFPPIRAERLRARPSRDGVVRENPLREVWTWDFVSSGVRSGGCPTQFRHWLATLPPRKDDEEGAA